MKRMYITVFLLLFFVGMAAAQATPPKPPANAGEVMDRAFTGLEKEFVPAAEAMPADKYDFAPTNGEFKGVRTFAQQVKHVAAVNYLVAAALLGEKPPVDTGGEKGPDSMKSKDDIVKFIKGSCEYTHKALATVNDKNVVEMIDGPFGGKSSRLGLASIVTWHSFDHYGQMVEYLRMNGIIPPASRQQ